MTAMVDPTMMNGDAITTSVGSIVAVALIGMLLGVAIYVWYALALCKLFPRLNEDGWKGWVPILNEATILSSGGRPAWNVVFYFVPILQFYGLYLKVLATHSINQRFGRGAGFTVLAILLPPVWATVLAWGAPPYPEADRLARAGGERMLRTLVLLRAVRVGRATLPRRSLHRAFRGSRWLSRQLHRRHTLLPARRRSPSRRVLLRRRSRRMRVML
jgi:hypothetical protein